MTAIRLHLGNKNPQQKIGVVLRLFHDVELSMYSPNLNVKETFYATQDNTFWFPITIGSSLNRNM